MKPYIIGVALFLLSLVNIVYVQDRNNFMLMDEYVKYCANECSRASSLFYDEAEYSEGRIVFDKSKGDEVVNRLIKSWLKTDSENTYFSGLTYEILYFDDGNTTFPYLYEDDDIGYKKVMGSPQIVVRIHYKPTYRLKFLSVGEKVRSSAFEQLEY